MEIYKNYMPASGPVEKTMGLMRADVGHREPFIEFCTSEVTPYPRIGLYVGEGASHSWLWFVDLFEKFGFYDLSLLGQEDVKSGDLQDLDILCISGGDTFRIAGALGGPGGRSLEGFINQGGIYMGSCAGAYLALNSSKSPLNLFNYVDVKISNLTKSLPEVRTMPHKFCTNYGCKFIFHPVRDEVRLFTTGFEAFGPPEMIVAPLYGGPPMIPASNSEVLATYTGFTDKTIFLVDEKLAEETLINRAAVIRKTLGRGALYLFGPHFEHPYFPRANEFLIRLIGWETAHKPMGQKESHLLDETTVMKRDFLYELKRHVSNSRVVAGGLEMLPVHWIIGNKIYEPGKIRVFLDSVWKRIKKLGGYARIIGIRGEEEFILQKAEAVTRELRQLKRDIDLGVDTNKLAQIIFMDLSQLSSVFIKIYFRSSLARYMESHWDFSPCCHEWFV